MHRSKFKNSTCLAHRRSVISLGQNGSVLIEFSIVLPFILLAVAAVVDIGSLLFQTQLAADAARYGTRQAALESLTSTSAPSCLNLKNLANVKINEYMTNTLKIPNQVWKLKDSSGNNSTSTTQIQATDVPGFPSVQVIQATVQVTGSTTTNTCLFCYLTNFLSIGPQITITYVLPNGCT